jgi:hypothetical protein
VLGYEVTVKKKPRDESMRNNIDMIERTSGIFCTLCSHGKTKLLNENLTPGPICISRIESEQLFFFWKTKAVATYLRFVSQGLCFEGPKTICVSTRSEGIKLTQPARTREVVSET